MRTRRVSQPLGQAAAGPGGEAQRTAAAAIGDFAARVSDLADRSAVREGEREGMRAGIDPEFRPRRDGTLRGEAYDRAGLRSAKMRTGSALREKLAEAFDAAQGDAGMFSKAAEDVRAQFVETAPEEIRPDLEADFAAIRFGYDREHARLEDKAEADALGAEALGLLDTRVKDIGRSAYQGGLDGGADLMLTSELGALEEDVLAYGPKSAFTFRGKDYAADPGRAGVLSLEQIEGTLLRAGSMVGENRVKGAFSRIDTLEGKRAFLSNFMEDYGKGEGVPGTMSLDEVQGLEREMKTEIRSLEAEARAQQVELNARVREIRGNLQEYRSFAQDGLVPPPDVLQTLEAEALATGDAGLIGDVRDLGRLTSIARAAGQMSPVDLANEINSRRVEVKGGATPQQAAEIGVLESTLAGMRTGLKQDPYGFAVRAGVIEPVPFYPGEEGWKLTLYGRAAQSRKIEATYGVKGALFTAEEMDRVSELDRNGGAPMVDFAATLVEALKGDASDALARLSDNASLTGTLGELVLKGGSRDAVNAAAEGRRLTAESQGVAKGLSASTSGLAAQSLLAGALGHHGEARRSIEEAANAIYIGRKGLNAEWDETAYRRALQQASGASWRDGARYGGIQPVGGGMFRGGQAVVLPTWLRADRAGDVFSGLTLEDYRKAGQSVPLLGDGSEAPEKAIRQARPVSVGYGVYRLALGDPQSEDPQYLLAEGGDYYELDLDELKREISVRMPEAVGP